MTNKLINNMKFTSADKYNKSMEIPEIILKRWETSIRSQMTVETYLALDRGLSMKNCYKLVHNARTNVITFELHDFKTNNSINTIEYKLVKYIYAADLFNNDKTINKQYYEMLIKLMMDNMVKI